MGDRQPDRARHADPHRRKRRSERRRVASAGKPLRADGNRDRPSPEAVEKLPPSVSCSRSRAGTTFRPRRTCWTCSRRSCGCCWCCRWARLPERSRCRATGADRHRRRLPHVRGIALFAVRTIGGSVVTDALADAPNAHAVADDAWAIATSLLVDAAEGSFLFGLFLAAGAWLVGEGRRATAIRRVSAYPLREHPGLVRAGLGGRDPAARHLGAGSVDTEALGDRDLHCARLPLARARPAAHARSFRTSRRASCRSPPWRSGGRAGELERLRRCANAAS